MAIPNLDDNLPAPPPGDVNVKWQQDTEGRVSGHVPLATGGEGGIGDVVGPSSAVHNHLAAFDGATGKVLKDSTLESALVVTGPASATTDDVATFNGTTGKLLKDSGIASALITAHHTRHESGGADAIKLDDLAAPDDNTDLNASSTRHGLQPKSPADATKFLNGAATPAYAQVKDADLSTSDVTTNNSSSTKHGFAPKSPADATQFLNGAATPAYAQVKESDLATSDVATNNSSTSKHGFLKKLDSDTTHFMRGDGTWAVPPGTGTGTVTTTGSPASGELVKFSGASSITNGDLTGDVTTSGGLATTIAANAVDEGKIGLSDVTTNNSSTSKHGFLKKLDSDTTHFMRGDGTWAVPGAGGGGGGGTLIQPCFLASDGNPCYISVASNAAFNIGSPSKFTVQILFRPTFTNINAGLATRSSLSSSQGDWACGFFNGSNMRPTFRLNNNATSLQSSTSLTISDHFYNLAFVYDSSLAHNNMKIFIDGTLDCQQDYSTVITNNAVAVVVGVYFTALGHGAAGFLSEFDFAAATARFSASYSPGSHITPDGSSTIFWKMDGDPIGKDTSGNGFDGTFSTAAKFESGFRIP